MFTLAGFVVVIFVMGITLRRFCRHGISRGQHWVYLRRYEEIQLSSLVDVCEVHASATCILFQTSILTIKISEKTEQRRFGVILAPFSS